MWKSVRTASLSTGRPCSVVLSFQISRLVTVSVIWQASEYGEVETQSKLRFAWPPPSLFLRFTILVVPSTSWCIPQMRRHGGYGVDSLISNPGWFGMLLGVARSGDTRWNGQLVLVISHFATRIPIEVSLMSGWAGAAILIICHIQ